MATGKVFATLTVEDVAENMRNRKAPIKYKKSHVEVMAIADGYAMVRHKGCAPFVCRIKCLDEFGDSLDKAEEK